MALTFKEVAEILKIIDASQCEELVLEMEGARLIVRRGGASAGAAAGAIEQSNPAAPVAPAAATTGTTGTAAPDTQAGGLAEGLVAVRSPMVGTFYRSAEPGKPPFVEPGTKVKKGDALCLIEVMKLFTTIEATADGMIDSILVEDAEQVEFDQILFAIRPN
jgi:acetyl-CoA carboxylase biotin carboxyl carrier protein